MRHPYKRRFTALSAALFVHEMVFQFIAVALMRSGFPLFADGGLPMILGALLGLSLCFLMLKFYLLPQAGQVFGEIPIEAASSSVSETGAQESCQAPTVRLPSCSGDESSWERQTGDSLHQKPNKAAHKQGNSMTLRLFLTLFVLMCGMQLVSYFMITPLTELLERLGFSLSAASEAASGGKSTPPLVLYAVLVAPLVEELLYRGIVLRMLRPCGRIFALGISALLFALMHGNLLQFLPALLLGLLFAWIAERFGLRYSILLHLTNNLFVRLSGIAAAESLLLFPVLYGMLMFLGFFSGLIWFSLRGAKKIYTAIQGEPSCKETLRCFFTTPAVLLLFLFFILLTMSNLN